MSQIQIELTPHSLETRVSGVGLKIDGKTFDGCMMLYLNQDDRSVRVVMAKGSVVAARPLLCRYFASHGFKTAVFSHNAEKDDDKPKLTAIDLTRRRWGYNPDGNLCRTILSSNPKPATAGFLMPENQEA